MLECVETSLSKLVTKKINIPTIGIGASNNCDGQILVFDDLIGLNPINVRFVKKYSNIRREMAKAVASYARDVKKKKCKFFLATGKDNDEQLILNEILESKYKNFCTPLDNLSIKETLPIIKNCNLSIVTIVAFSHLSAALGIKTITLMADTPLIYGSYSSNMYPIIPDGETSVTHDTLGKDKINPEKIFNKFVSLIN